MDVWGRLRAGVDAASASAQSVEADYVYAQHSLSATIAKTYLNVIEAKQQSQISRKNVSILTETMRIAQLKYDNDVSSGLDIALVRRDLAIAHEDLLAIEGSRRDTLRSLEVLLGRYPNAATEIPDVLPQLPPQP
ncbi:MAG: TolC family protein, partial [Cycloclasticus sp.]|nr:TolC family protein [Cycloclasticus sp.]